MNADEILKGINEFFTTASPEAIAEVKAALQPPIPGDVSLEEYLESYTEQLDLDNIAQTNVMNNNKIEEIVNIGNPLRANRFVVRNLPDNIKELWVYDVFVQPFGNQRTNLLHVGLNTFEGSVLTEIATLKKKLLNKIFIPAKNLTVDYLRADGSIIVSERYVNADLCEIYTGPLSYSDKGDAIMRTYLVFTFKHSEYVKPED